MNGNLRNLSAGLVLMVCSSQMLLAQYRVASCQGGESIDPLSEFVTQTQSDFFGKTGSLEEIKLRTSDLAAKDLAACRNYSGTAYNSCDYKVEAQAVLDTMNSNAYQHSNPPIAGEVAFITALYQHLLQRKPDQGGLQFRSDSLKKNGDRVSAIYSFLTSDEYRDRFECFAGTRDHANLGINGHPLTQPAYSDTDGVTFDEQLTKVHESGAKWYRFDVNAPSVNPDYSKMDSLVGKAKTHGVLLLPVLFPVFDQANDSTSVIYQKSRDGAFQMVSRYKSYIHVWELSNERDIYSAGSGTEEQATDFDPHKYGIVAALLKGLADGVREADPDALRIIDFAGWVHTGFFQRLENDHIPYDIAGVHWYQDMGEITCPGQRLPCPGKLQHFNVIQRIEQITNGKPMWMTETNYQPLKGNSPEMNAAMKERYLEDTLRLYLSAPATYPFQTIMVYELLDEPNFSNDPTQSQMGMFSVTPSSNRRYALGTPKNEFGLIQRYSRP